jgi:hypothetical protein
MRSIVAGCAVLSKNDASRHAACRAANRHDPAIGSPFPRRYQAAPGGRSFAALRRRITCSDTLRGVLKFLHHNGAESTWI